MFALNYGWLWITGGPTEVTEYQEEQSKRFKLWRHTASKVWFLKREILWIPVALAPLAAAGALLRNAPPHRRVVGLVCERIFEPVYRLFVASIAFQIGCYCAVYAFHQSFILPDLRFTGIFRAVGALIFIYLPLTVIGIAGAAAFVREGFSAIWLNLRLLKGVWIQLVRRPYVTAFTISDDAISQDSPPDVLFLADLHTPAPGNVTIQGNSNGSEMEQLVRDLAERLRPKLIAVVGDLTDTGSETAWVRVRTLLSSLDPPKIATLGNHDVQFGRVEQTVQSVRRYFCLLLTIVPQTSHRPDHLYYALAQIGQVTGGEIRQFPKLYSMADVPVDILLLDSNGRLSRSPISNGIGYVGTNQILQARQLLATRTDRHRSLVLMLHHHVAPPVTTVELYFLACLDADEIIALAFEFQASVIVHGHLHMPYLCQVSRRERLRDPLLVVSCGSAQFDAVGPFAAGVGGPSAFGIRFDGRRPYVNLYRLRKELG